jgi:hypothetical protein
MIYLLRVTPFKISKLLLTTVTPFSASIAHFPLDVASARCSFRYSSLCATLATQYAAEEEEEERRGLCDAFIDRDSLKPH